MVKTKNNRIELRINPEDKEIIKNAAELKGLSISAYIISHILPSAKQELTEKDNLSLNSTDRDFFFDLLSNPPAPNESLKKLMRKKS